jgi:hypothetical protein
MFKGDAARSKTRERFETRLKRFSDRLISFPDIADWCADLRRNTTPREAGRAEAFEMLQRDLLAGDFEFNGRSLVRFLSPGVTRTRMSRSWLREAIEHNYDNECGQSYLKNCWLPQHPFQCWLAKHELPSSPKRFQRTDSHDKQAHAAPKSKLGSGAKTRGIADAIEKLFPSGIPKGLTAKERNNLIVNWLRDKKCSVPKDPPRAIQRVLKARQSK